MKTKLPLIFSLILLALSPEPCALSQIPQGFNYQAVAHNSAGAPVASTTIQVKTGILSDTLTPVIIWEELHSSVRTNAYGVFNLVIGTGTRQAGYAQNFNEIDWSKSPLFLKIQIYYQGAWKVMGHSKLWAVPYAMSSRDISSPLKKLSVAGETDNLEEALFEVKNKDGQTIFAVYNEGVRIYVSDGNTKGPKGGFAIGGFGTSKAPSQPYFIVRPDSIRMYLYDTLKAVKGGFAIGGYGTTKTGSQDYLFVSSDSIRAYIDNSSAKGPKGGFAIGGFGTVKNRSGQYFNVSTDTSNIIKPSQNRILWYPLKNAFLAGRVLIEKPDSVGINSFATGYESKARGQYSQALGYKAIARGDFATAIGKRAVANNINSFAFGDNAKALNDDSYAFGAFAEAKGVGSFAFGYAGRDSTGPTGRNTVASGNYSFAFGLGCEADSMGSIAFGSDNKASNYFCQAFGLSTKSTGHTSTTFGFLTEASGWVSLALGYATIASGNNSFAGGQKCKASGVHAFSYGLFNESSGNESVTFGRNTIAANYHTFAAGNYTRANGWASFAVGGFGKAEGFATFASGYQTVAKGNTSTASGISTIANSYASFVIGRFNDTTAMTNPDISVATDPAFVIGNGFAHSNRRNAFTVLQNGNTGIAMANPQQKLDIAGGNGRVESGYDWLTNSDIRYKKNITTIEYALEKVMNLRGVSFDLNNDIETDSEKGKHIGFIAQELEAVVPEVVVTGADGFKSVAYDKLTAVLAEAIKEQQLKIESQQKEIDELKALVNKLIEE